MSMKPCDHAPASSHPATSKGCDECLAIVAEAKKFFRQWQGPLETVPRDGPNTAAPKRRSSPPPEPDAAGDMFG